MSDEGQDLSIPDPEGPTTVAKPASINLRKLVLSPTSSINLGFILREDLLLCSLIRLQRIHNF
jgi:hypothetical protein